jgi:hypothetical protein
MKWTSEYDLHFYKPLIKVRYQAKICKDVNFGMR